MACLVKIRAFQDQLSPNEKKIARFILANAALLRDYSSQNLAASIGVSQSSIVKFSQKLGYKGFTDLKLAVHESVLRKDSSESPSDQTLASAGNASPAEKLLHIKLQTLQSTMDLNEETRLMAAVDVLEKADRIQIIALGAGSMVARNFASMLIQIGRSVVAEVDTYIQLSSVATLGRTDAVFVISFSGQSPRMLQIVKQAKKAGVTIVTLTNFTANPMRSLADVQLYSVSRAGDYEVPQIVSTTSQQYIVDFLFSQMVRRDRSSQELLTLSRKAVESI
jgi:DNA-binding MurR/RpiR family transcriptional regulator